MSGSITLRAAEADWLVRAVIPAASKDDVTPVLCALEWSIADGRATVTATDRYRVHQAFAPLYEDDADNPAAGRFLMTRKQAALLLKMIPRRDPNAFVDITWTEPETLPAGHTGKIGDRQHGSIHWTARGGEDSFSHEMLQVRGNFPPVARLFPSAEPTEGDLMPVLRLMPEFLADTRWLRSGHGSLRFVVPRVPEGAPKLQPVLVLNTEGTARALIQPYVGMNGEKEYGA